MSSEESQDRRGRTVPRVAPEGSDGVLEAGSRDGLGPGIMLAALLLGLVRFWRLGEWSVWEDEVFTLADTLAIGEVVPRNPVFYGLMSVVLRVFPGWPDELILRLFPAVFGWLVIPIAAWAFAPILGRRRGAAAALLLAVSSWHVYWSQNARFYTLAQDLALLGGGLVLRGLFLGGGRAVWRSVLGLLAVVAGALVHATAGLLLPAMLVATWVLPSTGAPVDESFRRQRRLFAWIGGASLLAILPWAREVWLDFFAAKRASSTVHFALTSGFFFTPILLIAALVGTIRAVRQRTGEGVWIGSVCATAVGIVIVASFFVQASAQYVFVLLPWVAALATLASGADDREVRARSFAVVTTLVAAPLAVDTALYFGLRHGDRPRWREAFEYVWERRQPEDLVLTNCAPVAEYYFQPGSINLRRPVMAPRINRYDALIESNWGRQERRTWFVLNRERMADWKSHQRTTFLEMLATDCGLKEVFEVKSPSRDLNVLVYLRN